MPSTSSWKDAYLLRAERLASEISSHKTTTDITAADIANADFRKKLKASPVSLRQPDYQGPEQQSADELDKRVEAGGFDGFLAQTEKVANTPVIKEALNVLSTGAYATANTADNILDGVRNLRDGNLRGISDIAMAPVTGLAQGINAGIAQSEEDATLWGDVIKHATEDMGMDAENDAAKWTQGLGGFAGDVLLDPTTYLSLGTTALAKGAVRGAKEASKASKSLAEEMLKNGVKAEDDIFRDGAKSGATVKEVAENTHGKFSNAAIEAIKAERDWRAAHKARKAQRKALKSDNSEAVSVEPEFVGTNVREFNQSVLDNEAAAFAPAVQKLDENLMSDFAEPVTPQVKAESNLPETTPLPVAEVKEPDITDILDEILEGNAPAPKVEEPVAVPKAEPEKAPAVQEMKEALEGAPVVAKASPEADDFISKTMQERGKKFEEFKQRFQTRQYKGRDVLKALAEPEFIVTKKPVGEPRRISVTGSDYKASDFISRNPEGRDAKKAQAVKKAAKDAVIKDKDFTKGPQQFDKEHNPFRDEEGNPAVPNSDTLDNYIDFEALEDFAKANPDARLTGNIKGGGVTQIKLKHFIDSLGNMNPEKTDKLIKENLHFFTQFAHEGAVAENSAELAANFQKALDDHHGIDAPVAKDPVDEILDDNTILHQDYEETQVPNPNYWNAETAAKYLKEEHRTLSVEEIASLTRDMTNTEIKRLILKEEDALNQAELRALREFTGKESRADVADRFIEMKREYDLWSKKKKTSAPKSQQPTRAETAAKIADKPIAATEENIAKAQEDATEAAETIVSTPGALDEVVQRNHRLNEFEESVRELKSLEPKMLQYFAREVTSDATEGVLEGAKLIKNSAHKAVKAGLEVQLKEAPFKTFHEGMNTMTEDIATGNAWRPDRWGSNSQLALYNSIIGDTVKAVPNLRNKYDALMRRRYFMASLKIADKELRAAGVEPFLNHVDTAGKFTVNLSTYDIFRSIEEAGMGGELQKVLFGGQLNAYTLTQIQGAVESMIKLRAKGVDEEKVLRSIRSNLLNSQTRNGRPIRNDAASVGLRNKKTGALTGHDGAPVATGATRARLDAAIKNGVSPEIAIVNEGRRADVFAKVLADPRVYQKLNYNMLINHAQHASILGERIEDLSEATIEQLKKVSTLAGPGQVFTMFKGIRNDLAKQFNPNDLQTAKLAFDTKLAGLITESERAGIDLAERRAKLSAQPKPKEKAAPKDVVDGIESVKPSPAKPSVVHEPKQDVVNATHVEDAKTAEVSAKALIEEAKLIPENVIADDVVDQTVDLMAASVATAAQRKLHPIQKLVNPALGLSENTLRAINSGSHSIARQQAHFHESLDMFLRRYTPEQLAKDFAFLQELGRDATKRANGAILLPEDAHNSLKELYGIIGTMFEVSAANVFARNAIGVSHFNKLAQANGLPDMWRFLPDKTAVENGHLWTEWTGIEEKGIQDFLSRMHSITVKASQEIAIAADFSMRFGSKTNDGGKLVKIKWTNQKENNASFYDLIDKNLYYPRDIASQIIHMDRLMSESRTISPKNPFGRFVINVFDPITNALKASQTTVRPGHWVVSVIGDLLRNQIAGVNSIQPYRHAVEIMRAAKMDPDSFIGRIDSAEALSKYRKSQEIAKGFTASGNGKGVVLHVGGKKVNVDYETLYKILNDVVMLPRHRGAGGVLEDRFVGEAITSKFARGLEKGTDFVTDNKKFSLNELAAKRDNFMRISMAIDFASKRKWNNLREMKAGMEGQVTKWAPTSTDMTAFESKYVRRSMLYYTWLRGITPRMIDAAMTRPGVTTMVPKALYNVAYANGLNPESIGNPFPEDDGLFPSYYFNNVLGPQWKDEFGMWGINPSSPVIEVANTFSRLKPGDPVGNAINTGAQLTGMATPFVRMPIEGALRTQSNGIPITDGSQYMLDNLGGSYVGALSRATGKTVNANGIVDRTDSAAKDTPEEQLEHAKLQAFNFLTGLKLTDYKSESAERAAYYDQKEALNAEAERLRRGQ